MKFISDNLATGQKSSQFSKQNHFSRLGSVLRTASKSLVKRNTIVEIISALLIILFIYTAVNKILDIEKFKFEMGRSPFIENWSEYIAYSLPPGELVISILLILKRTRLLGLYLSFALMAFFTGYIWLMLNYAPDLPCSCGGIISKLSWRGHLIFNTVFTGLPVCGVLLIHLKSDSQNKRSHNQQI